MRVIAFLDAFSQNRKKATVSFVMRLSVCLSVRPSVRMEQIGSR